MTSQEFKIILEKLPDEPGVYLFRDRYTKVLYIGKATSLRDRVRSYFANDLMKTRGQKLVDMVTLAANIDHVQTDSVLEALVLEANLISRHQPKYNTAGKDNKSYNYVVITREQFPKVMLMRGRTLLLKESEKYKYAFGPFPHGGQLKEAMKIIRRIFPYSDNKCTPCLEQQKGGREICRPCFNRQIGLCPGVCTGEISEVDYAERIQNIKMFFDGKKKALVKNLEKDMRDFAERQEFEKAGEARPQIFALNHIQDIALLKSEKKIDESAGGEFAFSGREGMYRIEAYDIAHSSGTNVVGVMTVVEDDEMAKSEYRKFKIRINPGVNDTGALKEILRRRLGHLEWSLPDLIVVDGAVAQMNAAKQVLFQLGFTIDVVAVVKDERHKPKEILGEDGIIAAHGRSILLANNEAHRFAITYHRKKRDRIV